MTDRRRLTPTQARATIETTTLTKAPDWADTRRWHVVDGDGTVLVVVSPSYGGASRSGRNGWKFHLAALGPNGSSKRWPNRQQAAAAGLAAWERWATALR